MAPYNDRITARFLQATVVWGILGLLTGLYTSLERLYWPANGGVAFLTFGRLLSVHNTIVVYAWAANAFFAGLYYALQRLCQTRIWSDRLADIHYWGWQVVLAIGVISLSLGVNQGRALAELEWPLDILLLIVWVLFAVNAVRTLQLRRVKYLYITLWFLLAGLLTFPLLHIVNALSYPMSPGQSYPLLPGVVDAMLQVWYEQNVINFLLTMPFLGLMYYFVPKAAARPLYSYRLAELQFWIMLAVAVWLGPRQLLYSSLPEWLQSLGVVAGLMLLAPGWGGVVNGLMTLGWDRQRLRTESYLGFFALALGSFGLLTLLAAFGSFKSINIMLQYTDWMQGQRQFLLFGWLGSLLFGIGYYLVPRLWGRPLHSTGLARMHLGMHLLSLLLLFGPDCIAGLMQSWFWFARQEDGVLIYPQFMATLKGLKPLLYMNLGGMVLMLVGALVAVFNFYKTTKGLALQEEKPDEDVMVSGGIGLLPLSSAIIGAVLLSLLVEILPLVIHSTPAPAGTVVKPLSALALQGRDLYIREGCVNCHTQMVRWSLPEELRYGPASQPWEYQFQGPTLWGLQRLGPDLHRVGGKFPETWHYQHLLDPRSTVPDSTMPPYPWLQRKMRDNPAFPRESWQAEAQIIQGKLVQSGINVEADSEIIAMIAYLQRLGTDLKP